nr:MAG TPA: capsid scaffolding protein [Caudoviricetes sp.]
MSEEINATVSTESTETVDTQENVDTVQEEKHERTFTRAEIGKMLSAERSKWEAEQEAKENEAKKLAKMNADEKQKYQLDQREQELANREKAIARKELTAEAKAMLSERDLPVELVNVVDLTSAETVSQSVAVLQKSWEQAVQKGVQEKLKGKAPINHAPTVNDELTVEEFRAMGYKSRNELFLKNPELYKKLKG